MKARTLTSEGSEVFRAWLSSRRLTDALPESLVHGELTRGAGLEIEVDPGERFSNRMEFGRYMLGQIGHSELRVLLAPQWDGLWDWLTALYFEQFGRKVSKPWHYVVTRRGHAGSLAYRHLARTSAEMYWRHGDAALVMLSTDLATWGDMSEQLTSRIDVAYNKTFITAANALYLDAGKLRRGAAGRVPPKKRRQQGDSKGRGGVARLALAARRLSRTYDVHGLAGEELIELLPKEFLALRNRADKVAMSKKGKDSD